VYQDRAGMYVSVIFVKGIPFQGGLRVVRVMETLDDGVFPLYMGFQRSMFRPLVAEGSMCSDAGCHMMSKNIKRCQR
jgi:hypothetical protein